MKVFVSDKAKRDLLRIYSYVSQDNPDAATAILRRIDARLGQLSRFPFIGRERSNLAMGLRGLLAGNYVIFYTVAPDSITVVRVIDGRMDIDEEFRR
jgi:toxin ParE1/3/4